MNIAELQRINFQAWDKLPAPEKVDIHLDVYYDLSGFLCHIRYGREFVWDGTGWVRI